MASVDFAGMGGPVAHAASDWLALLFTYAAHVVLWTGAVAAADKLAHHQRWPWATRNVLWKLALFGPMATTLIGAAIFLAVDRAFAGTTQWWGNVLPRLLVNLSDGASPPGGHRDGAFSGYGGRAARACVGVVLAVGIAVPALGLMRFVVLAARLRIGMRGRTRVRDARLCQRLELICGRARVGDVVLTSSPHVATPLVVGAAEICVPRGLLTTLTDVEVDAVLAHELAHLERGDGVWFPAVGLVESLLWVDPLTHWAAARFRGTAELACDDRAVALTGDPLGLARALVEVATGARRFDRGLLLPAMRPSTTSLLTRVKRLAETGEASPRTPRRRDAALLSLAMAGLAAVTATVRIQPTLSLHHAPSGASAADLLSASNAVIELGRREQELEARIVAASAVLGADHDDTAAGTLVLDLRQELRHVRATQAWIEQQFVGHPSTQEKPE